MIQAHRTRDLAVFVSEQWKGEGCMGQVPTFKGRPPDPLPELSVIERILSTCFYASLLSEEGRPVRFRLILGEPHQFSPEDGPPAGLHRLSFVKPLPFNEQELRRIFPSADFHRSLIGVRQDAQGELLIWGIIHSGSRWVNDIYGGRQSFSPLPPSLVVCVTDPGRLAVCCGPVAVASLMGAEIRCPTKEVFDTEWFPKCFESTRAELWALHMLARERAGKAWARLDPDIVRRIAQQVDRRVISTIRNSRHGGTLVFLPQERAAALAGDNPYLTMRYQFVAEEPRNRFRTLIVRLMNVLAEELGPKTSPAELVGWSQYVSSNSETLSILEESIMEVAHFIAGLAAMDGAVVLTNKYEVLGCGAEIACEFEKVPLVMKALDAEATVTIPVAADAFGARHRSVYRLCSSLHDVIAIVISQDRTVRFVRWHESAVTTWGQVATSVFDI